MTVAPAAVAASLAPVRHRDPAVDLVRAVCITAVVALHAMMVGVTVTDAGPAFLNASDGTTWIVPLSWALQVMPLFFVIGGFSGATAVRRGRVRGVDGIAFVAGRVHRLLLPALVAVGTVGAMLALLAAAGVSPELVTLAGFRFAQPLWFLGVFLVCQALLPALLRLHERAPGHTISAIAAAAVCVDAARVTTGIDALGFLNLAFVWLTMQQLGFFLADGRIDALPRSARVAGLMVAVAGLGVSFATGIHSPDLVANINPPTTALLLVGIAHTALFSLFRAPLGRLSARRAPMALSAWLTPRAMSVYLWHMPVLLFLAGLTAVVPIVTGIPLPALDSPSWWTTRPLWLAMTAVATIFVSRRLAAVEALPEPTPTASAWRVGTAVIMGTAAVAVLLVAGTSTVTVVLAVALMTGALALARRRRRTAVLTIIGGQRPSIGSVGPLG